MRKIPLKRLVSRPVVNGLGLSGSENNTDDPRYIRITDIGADGKLRDEVFASQPRQLIGDAWVHSGDILVASVGATVGKSYLHLSEGDFCYAGYLSRVRPDMSKAEPRFLGYWMESHDWWEQVRQRIVGSTIENLSASKIASFSVPLVSLEEQGLIADYLDRETAEIDAFLEDLKQLKAYTAERARALLEHELWATAKEFAPLRRFLLRVDQGISPEADSSPAGPGELGVLKAGCTNHGRFDLWANKRLDNSDQFTASMFVAEGDLIVTRASGSLMHVGSAALVPHLDRQLAMSDKHYRLVTDDHLDSEYLALVMQTARWRTQLEPLVSGAQGLARNISIPNLKTLEVPVVSRMQQEEVKEKLREQVQKVAMASDDVDALISLGEERRSALISAAVTGQIDVTAQGMSAAEQLQDELEAKV
ncbi:restriction endonuclease subunit S [Corynebacterium sanguinis]|uniref:restriction endonuclease subunit S n=1 Tax=Corynebacterium sanguinis TaxID=2594913 RepID=UPI001185C0EE|nr:restriction endonuclease subunit S [Corynebacterium sanguinis]QDR76746.1 restriction endonuclease subunit S [Corynebacterium sanguinis]